MRILLFCLLIWLPYAAHAEISEATAKEKAIAFMGKEIVLRSSGWRSVGNLEGKGKKCFHFTNADEGIVIDVDVQSGVICRFFRGKVTEVPGKEEMTLEQAKTVAIEILKNRAKPPVSNLVLSEGELLDHGDAGKVYHFAWEKQVGDVIYPAGVDLSLDIKTGQPVEYLCFEHIVTLKSLQPQLNREQALLVAGPLVNLAPNWKMESLLLKIIPRTPQILTWRLIGKGMLEKIGLPETGRVGYESVAQVIIDATTGKKILSFTTPIQPLKRIQLSPPLPTPKNLVSQDYWPSWNGDQKVIAFQTFRWLDYGNIEANAKVRSDWEKEKKKPDSTLLMLSRPEGLEGVIAMPVSTRFTSVDSKGSRLAFEMGGMIYVLDLQTGNLGQCNDFKRSIRSMPSWHPTESLLAMSGTHSPSDGADSEDDDIFVAKISKYLGPVAVERQWCVAQLPGQDILPVYSPDGKWIVFAHQDKPTEKLPQPNWALYWVSSDPSDKKTPDKIVELVDEPERLSWMPDSNQVLVAYKKPPVASRLTEPQPKVPFEMIGVEDKTRKTLTFPELHDPDLPNGRPLFMKVATLSPDGKTITFSALRWSGSAQDSGSVCIYTVNLDGSDLKRITSPEDISIPSFVFPQKDITALNAWEKLQPKPNLGKPWSPETQRQERQKELEEREKAKAQNKEKTLNTVP